MTETKDTVPRRAGLLSMWKLIAIAVGAHAVMFVGLNPSMGRNENSPQALMEKARQLRAEGKFDEALEMYQKVVGQKPPVPAVFIDAEKAMHDVRMEGLDARRKTAEQERKSEDAAATGEKEAPPGQPGQPAKPAATSTGAPPAAPAVALPALPTIEGEL